MQDWILTNLFALILIAIVISAFTLGFFFGQRDGYNHAEREFLRQRRLQRLREMGEI
jgi:RsiW-degrading membrane proteinase PrsW (M82 family)